MIGNKGMMFNGHDFSPWLDANPQRSILPPVDLITDEIPGKQGTRFRRAKFDELSIPVKVRLRASSKDNIAELRHKMASMLWTDKPSPLILGDDPTRYHLAILDGSSDLDRLWHTGSAELTFRCPDPVAFGDSKSITITTKGVAFVGGTSTTFPLITAKPATGSYYKLTNVDTGEYVQVNAPFSGDQTLVIDCEKQHCTLNGVSADRYVVLVSDYFEFHPGTNNLTANNGTTTIEWVERWL